MSEMSRRAHEMSLFAAREFVARFDREMGAPSSPIVTERMRFAYEMGYLRGHADGIREAVKLWEEMSRATEAREATNEEKDAGTE